MKLTLESAAFRPGETIPTRHTHDGLDLSPPLAWRSPPPKTAAFALSVTDPDAPRGLYTHWVLWDLPGTTQSVPEGVPRAHHVLEGAHQGRNSAGTIGWSGPSPPPGRPHRYVFTLYALSARLELAPGSDRDALERAVEKVLLARAELVGTYGRVG